MCANIPYDPRHSERIPAVEREEIDQLLHQTLTSYNATNEEIQRLIIDCISNMTTSRSLSRELSAQGPLKRLWLNFTGKNQQLQSAINRSHSHAMYANQQLVILLMEQNQSAMEFNLYLDQKQHMIKLDFSEQLSQHSQDIQRICQILQKFGEELDEAVYRCANCSTFLQRDSVLCPCCGRMRGRSADFLNTEPARNAYQENLKILSDTISRKSLSAGDPLWATYDFVCVCDLPQPLQEQIDTIYTDTAVRIDALNISEYRLVQHFQKNKLSQQDAYCSGFKQKLRDILRNEKELIDEELDHLDHLDDQVKQLEYAIENLRLECGGEG